MMLVVSPDVYQSDSRNLVVQPSCYLCYASKLVSSVDGICGPFAKLQCECGPDYVHEWIANYIYSYT